VKIAVTSTGNELISEMDPRFGRAKYFVIVDPQTLEYEVKENKQNLNLSQGAGIQAAKIVADHNCGPKAFQVLSAAGIKVVTGAKGRVIDAVMQYNSGQLRPVAEANVEGHWV
jgi:predicted Fe-Mo cluster-binding NifX family protein